MACCAVCGQLYEEMRLKKTIADHSEEIKEHASDRLKAILGVGHGIKDGAFVSHEAQVGSADLRDHSV